MGKDDCNYMNDALAGMARRPGSSGSLPSSWIQDYVNHEVVRLVKEQFRTLRGRKPELASQVSFIPSLYQPEVLDLKF